MCGKNRAKNLDEWRLTKQIEDFCPLEEPLIGWIRGRSNFFIEALTWKKNWIKQKTQIESELKI